MEPAVKQAPEGSGKDLDTCGPALCGPHRGHLHAGGGGRKLRPRRALVADGQGPLGAPALSPVPLLLQIQPVPRSRSRARSLPPQGSRRGGCQGGTAAGQHPGPDLHACAPGAASSSLSLPSKFVRIAPVPIAAKPLGWRDPWGPAPQASSWARSSPRTRRPNSSRCTGALSLAAARRTPRAAT